MEKQRQEAPNADLITVPAASAEAKCEPLFSNAGMALFTDLLCLLEQCASKLINRPPQA